MKTPFESEINPQIYNLDGTAAEWHRLNTLGIFLFMQNLDKKLKWSANDLKHVGPHDYLALFRKFTFFLTDFVSKTRLKRKTARVINKGMPIVSQDVIDVIRNTNPKSVLLAKTTLLNHDLRHFACNIMLATIPNMCTKKNPNPYGLAISDKWFANV